MKEFFIEMGHYFLFFLKLLLMILVPCGIFWAFVLIIGAVKNIVPVIVGFVFFFLLVNAIGKGYIRKKDRAIGNISEMERLYQE